MPRIDEIAPKRQSAGARREAKKYRQKRTRQGTRRPKRRVTAATRRKLSKSMKKGGLAKKIAKLRSSLAAPVGRLTGAVAHPEAYIKIIIEAASQIEQPVDAKEFARLFIDQSPVFTNTDAGLAALVLEATLMEKGEDVYVKMVESVVENGAKTFTTTFQGKLTKEDLDTLDRETEVFMSYDFLLKAGAVDYDTGQVADFTIIECAPKPTVREKAQKLLPDTGKKGGLRPVTQEDYQKIVDDDGISKQGFMVIFPDAEAMQLEMNEVVEEYIDINGVTWFAHGGTALPNMDDFEEGLSPAARDFLLSVRAYDDGLPVESMTKDMPCNRVVNEYIKGGWLTLDDDTLVVTDKAVGLEEDEDGIDEVVSPEQKEIKKRLAVFFKKRKLKVRYKSSSGKASYIGVWMRGTEFPAAIRNAAITAVYGSAFKRSEEQPVAGNIMMSSISMKVPEWDKFLRSLGESIEPEVEEATVPFAKGAIISRLVVGKSTWKKAPKDYKKGRGKNRMMLRNTPKGTALVPVLVVPDGDKRIGDYVTEQEEFEKFVVIGEPDAGGLTDLSTVRLNTSWSQEAYTRAEALGLVSREVEEALSHHIFEPLTDEVRKEWANQVHEAALSLGLYTEDSEAIRSKFNAWCVRKEGTDDGKIMVQVGDQAFEISNSIEDVKEALDSIASVYMDLPDEFDMMAAAFLKEYCEDQGTPSEMISRLLVTAESLLPEGGRGHSIAERDERIERRSKLRLMAEVTTSGSVGGFGGSAPKAAGSVCPKCGAKRKDNPGAYGSHVICPKCGATMVGEAVDERGMPRLSPGQEGALILKALKKAKADPAFKAYVKTIRKAVGKRIKAIEIAPYFNTRHDVKVAANAIKKKIEGMPASELKHYVESEYVSASLDEAVLRGITVAGVKLVPKESGLALGKPSYVKREFKKLIKSGFATLDLIDPKGEVANVPVSVEGGKLRVHSRDPKNLFKTLRKPKVVMGSLTVAYAPETKKIAKEDLDEDVKADWKKLGIKDTREIGKKYAKKLREFLKANKGGRYVGYSVDQSQKHGPGLRIEIVGTKAIITVDANWKVKRARVIHEDTEIISLGERAEAFVTGLADKLPEACFYVFTKKDGTLDMQLNTETSRSDFRDGPARPMADLFGPDWLESGDTLADVQPAGGLDEDKTPAAIASGIKGMKGYFDVYSDLGQGRGATKHKIVLSSGKNRNNKTKQVGKEDKEKADSLAAKIKSRFNVKTSVRVANGYAYVNVSVLKRPDGSSTGYTPESIDEMSRVLSGPQPDMTKYIACSPGGVLGECPKCGKRGPMALDLKTPRTARVTGCDDCFTPLVPVLREVEEAKAFGLPGQLRGVKAHRAFMTGHAQAVAGKKLDVAPWASSKASTKAWERGYERGKKDKSEGMKSMAGMFAQTGMTPAGKGRTKKKKRKRGKQITASTLGEAGANVDMKTIEKSPKEKEPDDTKGTPPPPKEEPKAKKTAPPPPEDEPVEEPPAKTAAPPPPPEPEEEEPLTHGEQNQIDREDRGYTIDNVQQYFDAMMLQGVEQAKSVTKTKRHFRVKSLKITPAGEVRVPDMQLPKEPAPPMGFAPAGGAAQVGIEPEPVAAEGGEAESVSESIQSAAEYIRKQAKKYGMKLEKKLGRFSKKTKGGDVLLRVDTNPLYGPTQVAAFKMGQVAVTGHQTWPLKDDTDPKKLWPKVKKKLDILAATR